MLLTPGCFTGCFRDFSCILWSAASTTVEYEHGHNNVQSRGQVRHIASPRFVRVVANIVFPQQHNECASHCAPRSWKPACNVNCGACHWASENGPLTGNKRDTDAASNTVHALLCLMHIQYMQIVWSGSNVVWHISPAMKGTSIYSPVTA